MLENKKLTLFLLLINIIGFIIVGYALLKSDDPVSEKPVNISSPKEVTDEFGIISDSLQIYNGIVRQNETLSSIFSKFGISDSIVYRLSNEYRDTYDFRKIIAGRGFRIYFSNDSIKKVNNFVYEMNDIDYVAVDFNDTLSVYKGERKVTKKRKEVSGIIKYSLYTALKRNEADPELFVKLSNIFAWQIDFYHIQKGDRFKVIYKEQFAGKKSIGIGKVIAAYFNHMGEDYYAFDFNPDGKNEYFDENGKSLRKAFLKAPLEYTRISSRYSRNRFHPILKRFKAHLGTDYAAPTGTPIRSVADGILIAAAYSRGNGNYIKIKHNSVYTTQYLHMSKFAKGMHKGVTVKQGQIIGYVGSTGLATGPHLCYRFWKNGVQVDPLKEKIPSIKPLDNKYRKEFDTFKDELVQDLDKIKFNDHPSDDLISNI